MRIKPEVIDELLKDYKKPEDVLGENGLLKQLTKALLERALNAEMTHHLGYEKHERIAEKGDNARNGVSEKTLGFLARVQDKPVIVFADRAERDSAQQLSDPQLHLFKRQVGPIVLYEVSPLDKPKLLDLFYQP